MGYINVDKAGDFRNVIAQLMRAETLVREKEAKYLEILRVHGQGSKSQKAYEAVLKASMEVERAFEAFLQLKDCRSAEELPINEWASANSKQ